MTSPSTATTSRTDDGHGYCTRTYCDLGDCWCPSVPRHHERDELGGFTLCGRDQHGDAVGPSLRCGEFAEHANSGGPSCPSCVNSCARMPYGSTTLDAMIADRAAQR